MKSLFLTLTLSCIALPLLYGMTPDEQLFRAAQTGDRKQVREALDAGAHVNIQDNLGKTPLHYAVEKRNNSDIIKFLLEAGANISVKDYNNRTPLDKIKQYYYCDVVAFLDNPKFYRIRYMSKRLMKNYSKLLEQIQLKPTKELLAQAIDLGYVHAVKLLLKAGIKPNMQDLASAKQKYSQDVGSLYNASYATIGRMLLQHLRLIGQLKAPAHKRNGATKVYHLIRASLRSVGITMTECAYGPISKSGITQTGFSKDIIHTIASFTY